MAAGGLLFIGAECRMRCLPHSLHRTAVPMPFSKAGTRQYSTAEHPDHQSGWPASTPARSERAPLDNSHSLTLDALNHVCHAVHCRLRPLRDAIHQGLCRGGCLVCCLVNIALQVVCALSQACTAEQLSFALSGKCRCSLESCCQARSCRTAGKFGGALRRWGAGAGAAAGECKLFTSAAPATTHTCRSARAAAGATCRQGGVAGP